MQDTLDCARTGLSLSACLATLSREAIDRGGAHPASALRASRATSRRLSGEFGERRLDYRERRRTRAYYYAVLHNHAFEQARHEDGAYRDRLKVASLVNDLHAAHAGDAHIRREVEAFFGPDALKYLSDVVTVS